MSEGIRFFAAGRSKNTQIQKWENIDMRVGMGYDVHKLVEGRDLILGGVRIEHDKGLLGHSDADVVVHAIMDALLGAAALRDIGRHFPDTDPQYKGISSITLLKHVGKLLEEKMYVIENIDATIIAQKPKLLPYIDEMIHNVAEALQLSEDQVNIKATTEEGLDLPEARRAFPRTPYALSRMRWILWETTVCRDKTAAAAEDARQRRNNNTGALRTAGDAGY